MKKKKKKKNETQIRRWEVLKMSCQKNPHLFLVALSFCPFFYFFLEILILILIEFIFKQLNIVG